MVEDWVLIEAGKQSNYVDIRNLTVFRHWYGKGCEFRALCDMIAKYEQPPVDPLIREARELWAKWCETVQNNTTFARSIRNGDRDNVDFVKLAVSLLKRGIELGTAGDDNGF